MHVVVVDFRTGIALECPAVERMQRRAFDFSTALFLIGVQVERCQVLQGVRHLLASFPGQPIGECAVQGQADALDVACHLAGVIEVQPLS